MRILVNTISTKKNAGGAFQIANNFVRKTLEHPDIDWIYVTSKDLDAILPDEMKGKGNYYVYPTQPDFKGSYRRVKHELRELERKVRPDVVYSITAPSYFSFEAVEVMRFTNPWVTHPNKYSWAVLSIGKRFKMWLYCLNQKRLIKNAHYFVTQTETTKQGLLRITGVPSENVAVVSNVLPAFFAHQDNSHINTSEWCDFACVGAPVPHKNFDIIPDVLLELKKRGVEKVRFHTTIPEDDPMWRLIYSKLSVNHLEQKVVNYGRVSQAELAQMYRKCLYCFLPTLLEVFSASTIEAMFFGLKIVATDFPFNREVLGDSCLYYEPMNAADAAIKIMNLIDDKAMQDDLSMKMKSHLTLYDKYDKHFDLILGFLKKVANA